MATARLAFLRTAVIYGALLAAGSLLLAWLDWRRVSREWSIELYVLAIALLFAGLGLWLGRRIAPPPAPRAGRNAAALAALGISMREVEVLDLLAAGHANKVIARQLAISPNTVKTHVARLFAKLDATTRTEAVAKARELDLLG